MATTYYLADLKCNHCGLISPKTADNDLTNNVWYEVEDKYVEKGDVMEIDLDDISGDFYQINYPTTNKVKCAELWGCSHCQQINFAELVFLLRDEDAILEDIKSVVLTPEYFDTLNYLSENIDDWVRYFKKSPVFPSHQINRLLQPTPEEIKSFREFLGRLQEEKKE